MGMFDTTGAAAGPHERKANTLAKVERMRKTLRHEEPDRVTGKLPPGIAQQPAGAPRMSQSSPRRQPGVKEDRGPVEDHALFTRSLVAGAPAPALARV